jgi:thiol-disulfide isomerase/thioredoxin
MAMNKNNVTAMTVRSDNDVKKVDKMLEIPDAKVYILLQAGWCRHCQDMKPKWKELENLPTRNVNIVSMPIEKQQKSQILKNVPVEGIPTVLEVRNGVAKAVEMEIATDVAAMAEEMSRPSNVPIDTPSTVADESQNAVVANEVLTNKNLPQVPVATQKQVPTNAMEELVQRIDGNSKNMGNTNGSRANNVARNLAAPVNKSEDMAEPKAEEMAEPKAEESTAEPKAEESNTTEVLDEKVEVPTNQKKAPVITGNKPKREEVDMSAPQKVEDSFLQKAEEMSTFMQEEAKKNIKEAESMPAVPKQRGGGSKPTTGQGGGGSKKRKGNLLKMLIKLGSPVFKRGQTRKVKKGKKAD